jgi:hypothetical protein
MPAALPGGKDKSLPNSGHDQFDSSWTTLGNSTIAGMATPNMRPLSTNRPAILLPKNISFNFAKLSFHDGVYTMFTLEQLNEIHDRLGRGESLAQYVKALNALGVETYDSYILDGHSAYFGKSGHTVISPPAHEMLLIADTSDKEKVLKHLNLHNQGKTSYLE